MARQNCSGLCKPSLLQSFRLFLHDSFSWRSAFQGRDCPLGGTALKTLSVRIPRRLPPAPSDAGARKSAKCLENTANPTACRDRRRGDGGDGARRVTCFGIQLASILRQLVPDLSGFKQQQLNLLEWDSPTHPSWFIKSGRVSFWFPGLRSHLVLIGNRSTRVETEQIDHLDHWSDAQANFARGAIDA